MEMSSLVHVGPNADISRYYVGQKRFYENVPSNIPFRNDNDEISPMMDCIGVPRIRTPYFVNTCNKYITELASKIHNQLKTLEN